MANGGRKLTIIAGVYTLIQGLLWSVLSILCVAMYGCIIHNPLIPLGESTINVYTLLYASYFNGSSCHDGPQFNGLDGPAPSSLRTYYWMLGYAIISAVWIPVSVLLIVSGVSKVKGVCGSYFYFPWILVSLIIVIMDIVAVVIYCIDITETMSTDEYVTFIGGHGTWEEMTGVGSSGQDPAAPAVVMILIFSRFIIFWFLNVSFIVHCIKESKQIRQFELQGSIASDVCTNDEKFRTWNRPNMNQHGFNFDEKRRTQFVTPPVNRSNRQRKNGASEVNINEDKNIIHESEPRKNGRSDPHPHRFKSEAQNNHQRFQKNPKQIEESRTNPKVMYEVDEFGIPIDEIKLPRANNSSYTDSTGSDTPISSPVFDYLGRPARPPPFRNGTDQLIGTESTVKPWNPSSQELRNQAPWSYLHPTPISQSPQPTIPAPDYTHPRHQRSHYAPSRPTIIKQKQNQRRVHGLQ